MESAHIEPSCPSLLLRLTCKLTELEAIQFFKVIFNLVYLKTKNNNGCFKTLHHNVKILMEKVCNLLSLMYFYSDLKRSVRSSHVTNESQRRRQHLTVFLITFYHPTKFCFSPP